MASKTGLFAVALSAAILAASGAAATMLGDQATITEFFPAIGDVYGPIAGPFVIPAGGYTTSVGESDILITVAPTTITLDGSGYYDAATFNGFDIEDLNPSTKITGVSLSPGSFPLPASDLSFDAHDVLVNVEDEYLTSNIVIDVTSTSAVPEPAGWTMMLAGLGLAGAVLRRRRLISI